MIFLDRNTNSMILITICLGIGIIFVLIIKSIMNFYVLKNSIKAKLISKTIKTFKRRETFGRAGIPTINAMVEGKTYILIFETETGEKIELNLDLENGDKIPLNEWGKLSYKKKHLLKFECDGVCIKDF